MLQDPRADDEVEPSVERQVLEPAEMRHDVGEVLLCRTGDVDANDLRDSGPGVEPEQPARPAAEVEDRPGRVPGDHGFERAEVVVVIAPRRRIAAAPRSQNALIRRAPSRPPSRPE